MLEIKVERIHRLDTDSALKGFADVNICDSFIIKGIRIIQGKDGLYVGMPQQLGKDGHWHNRITVINNDVRDRLAELILRAFDN